MDSDTADEGPVPPNFCYPIHDLSNRRIRLTPFVPSVHLAAYFALSSPHPELYAHTTFGPFASEQELLDDFISQKLQDPTAILFAIIDQTRHPPTDGLDGALAGIVGYLNSQPANLSTEIGFIFTLPPFQQTGVASTAVGLMLQHAFEPRERGGLALRRVEWQTNIEHYLEALGREHGISNGGNLKVATDFPGRAEEGEDRKR